MQPLDSLYFDWLYAKVNLSDAPSLSYFRLLKKMYETEFVWLVVGDDNRVEEGLDLRSDFLAAASVGAPTDQAFPFGCTVLEFLIAFSVRAEFQTEIRPNRWFWEFVSNLGLSDYYDDAYNEEIVHSILENFVWRTYDYNGRGGLFPLENPWADQTRVEIWDQFFLYLNEKGFE
jgi:hypothetical protein